MKSLPLKLGIAVVLLFAAVIAGLFLYHPIRYWRFEQKLQSQDINTYISTVQSVAAERERAIPYIHTWLKTRNKRLVGSAIIILTQMDNEVIRNDFEEFQELIAKTTSILPDPSSPIEPAILNRLGAKYKSSHPVFLRYHLKVLHSSKPHKQVKALRNIIASGKTGIDAFCREFREGKEAAIILLDYFFAGARKGIFPAHSAIDKGYITTVKILLAGGISTNIFDGDGKTALHIAAEKGDPDAVELLLAKRANINNVDRSGKTALQLAAKNRHDNITLLLINNGAEIVKPKQEDFLHWAARLNLKEVCRFLIDNGSDIEVKLRGPYWRTPLHFAAESGSTETARLLIEKGANINSKTVLNWTPLMYAVFNKRVETAKMLVEKGADVNSAGKVNSIGKKGKTSLHIAVELNLIDVIEFLIDKGANVNAMADMSMPGAYMVFVTPLEIAAICKNKKVAEILIANGADVNHHYCAPLSRAIARGDYEIVQLLINNGADIKKGDFPALHHAAARGHVKIISFLIKKGAEIDHRFGKGRTPLHFAIQHNHYIAAKHLIREGADLDAKDDYHRTALHMAVLKGDIEFIKYLIEKDANVNTKHKWKDNSPLDDAKTDEMKSLLRAHGAKTGKEIREQEKKETGK